MASGKFSSRSAFAVGFVGTTLLVAVCGVLTISAALRREQSTDRAARAAISTLRVVIAESTSTPYPALTLYVTSTPPPTDDRARRATTPAFTGTPESTRTSRLTRTLEGSASPTPSVAVAALSAGEVREPTTTPSPSDTPASVRELTAVVTARGLNIRAGPGVGYRRLGAVGRGTKLVLDGRDGAGAWVHGRAPEESLAGWLSTAYMEVDGNVMDLPVEE